MFPCIGKSLWFCALCQEVDHAKDLELNALSTINDANSNNVYQ